MGLEGTWYNELGSTLVITEVSAASPEQVAQTQKRHSHP